MNKYYNKKCEYNGIIFDSQKELKRYNDLILLEKNKKINNLFMHPKYILQEPFVDREGQRQRAIYYIADFQYEENGKIIVEDVKALNKKNGKPILTEVYKIKKKLFLNKYKDIQFREYY
jgi:hypothetical protein